MPCVSVIIPVYNTEPYFRQCLDSIINQTLSDIEIICINDGSTDNSLSILEEYAQKDSRIKAINKKNEGAAPARNLGLKMAQGKYLLFLDSDDFFELDMLELLVNKAEVNETDIVLCDGYYYDNETKLESEVNWILESKYLSNKDVFCYKDCPQTIFQIVIGSCWNKLFRSKFLKKHNLKFQKAKIFNDMYFAYMQMILAEKISIVNKRLVHYRIVNHTSISYAFRNHLDSIYLVFVKLKKTLLKFGIYEEVKQSFINKVAEQIRGRYDRITLFEKFKYLHEKCRNKFFKEFDILNKPKDFFYDERIYFWLCDVVENSAEELLFKALKQYGSDSNTSILRFKFPYELVEKGSKIILCGYGLTGRYYYTQILLSQHCEVVLWINFSQDKTNKELSQEQLPLFKQFEQIKNVDYDKILIAYASEKLILKTKERLLELGIPKNKII